jgi:AmmeMemoRadiSam system protein B
MIRQPAVAGTFYSDSADTLYAEIARLTPPHLSPVRAVAAVVPHAGHMYSGSVAGAVFAGIRIPGVVLLLGPNHTGYGPTISIYPEGTWLIPGAEVRIETDLAQALLARVPEAAFDSTAHRFEHCLEVQLPFLAYARRLPSLNPGNQALRVLPIVLSTTDKQICRRLGLALAEVVADVDRSADRAPLLVASTDMNHYESAAVTRNKDRVAIARIEELDPDGLADAVHATGSSMCGVGPTMAVLHAAHALGAGQARLIRYATSGEVNDDLEHVVGYAGFIIT